MSDAMTIDQNKNRTERLRAKAIADASLAMRGGSESAIMIHAQMSDEWQAADYIDALETRLSEMVKERNATREATLPSAPESSPRT